MLQNITIGQYFATGSPIHKLDPRAKILLCIAVIVLTFLLDSILALFVGVLFSFILMKLTKVKFKMYFKMLGAVLPIILITAVINLFYVKSGEVLFNYGIITITTDGIKKLLIISVRICLLIIFSSVLTYTTSPTELTDAIERLLSPLKFIGLSEAVHIMAMMTSIALRFIPILIEEVDKIMSAQKARGADIDSGNLINRIKALIPILIPLLISAVKRSYELAEAMECRCYHGGKGRTKMKSLRLSYRDFIACGTVLILFALIVTGRIYYTGFETNFINRLF